MSGSISSASVAITLEVALREDLQLSAGRLPALRAFCNAVAAFVAADGRVDDVLAYKLVMPASLFLTQVLSVSEEVEVQPLSQAPLQEALVQMVEQAWEKGWKPGSPKDVVQSVLGNIVELGYTFTRTADLTLEEAERITGP